MEANAGLVAGSHIRNELVLIGIDRASTRPVEHLSDQICKICQEHVGFTFNGEVFVACDECGFPVCRPCYEYERREGNKSCPQCKTRYKRLKGSPRVEGDDEEEDTDDIENEFNFAHSDMYNSQQIAEAMLHVQMNFGRYENDIDQSTRRVMPQIPLLTNGPTEEDDPCGIPPEHHALVVPPFMGYGGKRVHPLPFTDSEVSGTPRPLDPSKDLASYGYGSVAWKDKLDHWKSKLQMVKVDEGKEMPDEDDDLPIMDEARQPLSRKIPIPSARVNPYRLIIVIRLVVLGFFLRYRILNPVPDAFGLWLVSVICETWFAFSWILDQFPKWFPINRETYLDRLCLRYEKEGKPNELAPVDVYVSTVDPLKEPPIVTANTVLSILAVDYPVDKVSCYVSDDGAAMLTFEAMSETSEFARSWVPFCKKFNIEPRCPEMYFSKKIDYLKDKVHPSFVKERRAMKREYEEFKVRINSLVAKAQKVPEEGWTMQDGTPWPGNNSRDHPGMIQVFLGHSGGVDTDGNHLPRLVYVSREKRIGYNHHKKAGAMNACIRVSAVLTNAPYILNLDCDHYINNSKAIKEAMCFMMDPNVGKKVCYVQFPQRFDGIDRHDRYANNNTVFFDINLRGLDGVQGPVYVGTGCVFRRQALYGFDPPKKNKQPSRSCNCFSSMCWTWCCTGTRKKYKKAKQSIKQKFERKKKNDKRNDDSHTNYCTDNLKIQVADTEKIKMVSQKNAEKKYGQSPVFIASTLLENGGVPQNANPSAVLKEAIHVISCGYEDKTEWGKEIGWIYGSVTEDILTGFKMHVRGWRSIYCMPKRPAFKGSAPINLTDRLHQVLRWALGSVEIFLSRHCPIWYGYGTGLKWLERLAYINTIVYPLTSLPLLAYCTLPAICLLTGKFIIPTIDALASLWFLALFLSIFVTGILEMRWSGVGVDEWWRNEQFWVIGGVSAHLFALFQGLLKVLAGIDTSFTVTSKQADDEEFAELYQLKWTTLMIPPTTLLILNIVGVVAGIADSINNGYQSWGPLFGKLFFAIWVIMHLYPFLKGLMGRQNRIPTIVIVWSILLASILSLLWVRVNPFLPKGTGPILVECGLQCDNLQL